MTRITRIPPEPVGAGAASPLPSRTRSDRAISAESRFRSLALPAALLLSFSVAGLADEAPPRDGRSARDWESPKEASLPEGFPTPSFPGEIRVKFYPRIRAAAVQLEGPFAAGTSMAFWPLFGHIKKNKIAMTAPVVADYAPTVATEPAGRMRVSFVYPHTRMGRLGSSGPVTVTDTTPMAVVSIGVLGPYEIATMRPALERLSKWLKENGGTWRMAGEPRRLMYQRPTFANRDRLYSEVQVPIRPAPLPRPDR
jgi:hypothetical protein